MVGDNSDAQRGQESSRRMTVITEERGGDGPVREEGGRGRREETKEESLGRGEKRSHLGVAS